MEHILVVEDEPELRAMLRDFLVQRGFRVSDAKDGAEALRMAFSGQPDLVILDLNLPVLDGIDVATTLRSQTNVPIIMTTARVEEDARLVGFEAGADDYVSKPFSMAELAARITAVLRRSRQGTGPDRGAGHAGPAIVVGSLVIDPSQRRVRRNGGVCSLTAAQFDIVSRMAREPGRVFTRLELLESFQDHAYDGYERSVDVHIKNIRKAIEPDPSHPQFITTVWGIGYRLETPDV